MIIKTDNNQNIKEKAEFNFVFCEDETIDFENMIKKMDTNEIEKLVENFYKFLCEVIDNSEYFILFNSNGEMSQELEKKYKSERYELDNKNNIINSYVHDDKIFNINDIKDKEKLKKEIVFNLACEEADGYLCDNIGLEFNVKKPYIKTYERFDPLPINYAFIKDERVICALISLLGLCYYNGDEKILNKYKNKKMVKSARNNFSYKNI